MFHKCKMIQNTIIKLVLKFKNNKKKAKKIKTNL